MTRAGVDSTAKLIAIVLIRRVTSTTRSRRLRHTLVRVVVAQILFESLIRATHDHSEGSSPVQPVQKQEEKIRERGCSGVDSHTDRQRVERQEGVRDYEWA